MTTSFSDSGLASGTSYSYRVRASDASGNFGGYSNVASAVTTSRRRRPGWWPPTRSTRARARPSPTLRATATPARSAAGCLEHRRTYGGALSFNGVDSLVRVANSASLNLGAAMTLEAWIQPTAAQSGWRTIVQREVDAYFLNASTAAAACGPPAAAHSGGATVFVSGPTASPVNAWTHVALTYDGTILQLYVNGVQAASQARTGSIQASSNPLRIGGNSPYGEYFQGLIDEVRIYNRALTQAEIQTDMATPIGPAAPDTTPPSVPGDLTATVLSAPRSTWAGRPRPTTWGSPAIAWSVARARAARTSRRSAHRRPTAFSDTGLAPGTSYTLSRARHRCGRQLQWLLERCVRHHAIRTRHHAAHRPDRPEAPAPRDRRST